MADLLAATDWPEFDSLGMLLRETLPDGYIIVAEPVVRGQALEAVVVAPRGIFVLHSRDWTGEIRPVARGDWRVNLDSGQEGQYPSPAGDAQRASKSLRAFLQDELPSLKPQIQHLVVLTNPDATLASSEATEPMAVTPDTLADAITALADSMDGSEMDPDTREDLAIALRDRRLTARQRATLPFIFRSGTLFGAGRKVWTVEEAVRHMDRRPEDGIFHLRNGTLARWLREQGAEHLARLAEDAVGSRDADLRVGLETFLVGTGLVPRPKLKVEPLPVNLGCVAAGQDCTRQIHIRKGRGRGYLYGSLHTSEPWLRVEPRVFSGQGQALVVSVDSSSLPISQAAWQANILIDSSASEETIAIPVRVRVVGPPPLLNRYLVRPLVGLLLAGGLGLVVGWLIGSAGGVTTPAWFPGSLSGSLFWALVVGLAWAVLGGVRGGLQRPAWPVLYASGRWLLRLAIWAGILALVAWIGYWLWRTFLAGPQPPGGGSLPLVLGALALAILPAALGEIRDARLGGDQPLGSARRLLLRPLLWSALGIVLVALGMAAASLAGPTWQRVDVTQARGTAAEWIGNQWFRLEEGINGFVDRLYLERYDRRAPAGPTPTLEPLPSPTVEGTPGVEAEAG